MCKELREDIDNSSVIGHTLHAYPVDIPAGASHPAHVTKWQRQRVGVVFNVEVPRSLCPSDKRRKRRSSGGVGGRPAFIGTLPYLLEITSEG